MNKMQGVGEVVSLCTYDSDQTSKGLDRTVHYPETMAQKHTRSQNGLLPIIGKEPRVLILGSFPGVKSLEHQQYYAHPRNAFWPIMSALFSFSSALPYTARCNCLCRNRVALWDVMYYCRRRGSLDSAIEASSIQVNDFKWLFTTHRSLQAVYFNGTRAETEFIKRVRPALSEEVLPGVFKRMPSTSPAFASLSLSEKLKVWGQMMNHLQP